METLIELTEADLDQIAGGVGVAFFSHTNTASGGLLASAVTLFAQSTTTTSAYQTATIQSISI